MQKHLNTLFITTQKSYLAKEGECVLVRVDKSTKARFPIHMLDGIVCFGNVTCSPFLLGHCATNDVAISFLTEYGRFLARVQGPVSGNVLLRREQYRIADDPNRSADMARSFLAGKIVNSRAVLRRACSDHSDKIDVEPIRSALSRIKSCTKRLRRDPLLDGLRGIEGEAANTYFNVFDHLITDRTEHFRFTVRSRRPPLDRINCLLSFIYTLLTHDIRSALESVGLDPAVGFLHRDRPGRPSLALDLMEEFRPFLADRLVLSLVNLGRVKASDFVPKESGAVLMTESARKTVLTSWQNRKQDIVTHPYLQEKMPIGLLFYTQSMLLARHIRGDMDAYPPFFWK